MRQVEKYANIREKILKKLLTSDDKLRYLGLYHTHMSYPFKNDVENVFHLCVMLFSYNNIETMMFFLLWKMCVLQLRFE